MKEKGQKRPTPGEIPSANVLDSSVKLISGAEWYSNQAFCAVNQAVGRVIRHKDDYGAILLLDERFMDADSKLSAWLRPAVLKPQSFGAALSSLGQVRCAFNYWVH